MEGDTFEEEDFFRALNGSGARVLLIGRRALVALGLPVLTADYDLWCAPDDVERLNAALAPLDLWPNRSPDEARARGRYVLENGERVDVLVARQVPTVDAVPVSFDDVWSRREAVTFSAKAMIQLPSVDDLILTKRFGGRPKDLADIELLESLRKLR